MIADTVERRNDVGGEFAGLRDHRLDSVLGKIAKEPFTEECAEAGAVLERKGNIGNRRLVGHECALSVSSLGEGCTRGSLLYSRLTGSLATSERLEKHQQNQCIIPKKCNF